MIRVNDDPLPWQEGMTVRGVIEACNYRFPMVIVTVDGTFVPRLEYDTSPVPDGADVKVIHMVSGG